ncbi:MAG: hypothetical protein U9P90_04885 [Patescibacteria group bacterium]|nr:hypothetical protein [Patescibacteria group bacterium]
MSFSTGISMVGGNLQDEEIKKKIEVFFNKYFDVFRESAVKTHIGLANFNLGRPNNFYFAVDRKRIHFIFSSDFAGGIKEIVYIDLRDQKGENFSTEEVALFFRSQKGFTRWSGFNIDQSVLKKKQKDIDSEATKLAQDHIKQEFQELIKKHQPLFISDKQIESFLEEATEDELIQILLVPLLRHLGFRTAEAKGHRDKTLEFGQDIQKMKIQIPTGHWLYFSAQVKKGNIKYGAATQKDNVEKILTQTHSQLEWEMPDPEMGINVKPDHILLIVSGDIAEGAKQYIYRHSSIKNKKVLLWEKDTIIRLIKEKGLPEQIQNIIIEFNKKKDVH